MPRLFTHFSILADGIKAAAKRPPPRKENLDVKLPRVDVFVTYCGEGTDIVLNTAKAACVQDYPPSLIRVIVLDDSGSTQLENAISALRNSSEHPNLYYASRNIHVSTHSKAANLNFGISWISTLPGPTPDYISVLDVDMIPSPHWLKTVLASLLHHPNAALVCAFQRFYNVPPSDPLGMTHDLANIGCLIYLQNVAEEAWCTGSGFVVRRAALEQIGGFPEGHLQEDIMTSLLLSAAGWKTIYPSDDTLQWGLAADTMVSWIKQRQRWAAGVISISQFACSPQARQIPAVIRVSGLLWGVVDTFSSITWTLSMIILPLAVITGKPLLPSYHLRFHLHLALLDFLAQSTCHHLLSSLLSFHISKLEHVSAIWTAPLKLAIACRYIIPGILGRPLPRFKPTGIPMTGDSERAARKKGSSCLRVVLWECGGWMHALCLGACLVGAGALVAEVLRVSSDLSTTLKKETEEDHLRLSLQFAAAAFDALILRVGWPPLFLLVAALVKSCCIPIAYAVSPPPWVSRKDMLCEDTDTGVLYPTEAVKREFMKKPSDRFWWLVAGFHVAVGVGAEVRWAFEVVG